MQRAASAPNLSAFTVATPEIRPSAGVLLDEIVDLAPPALGGDRQRAIFDERTFIDELRDVLARRALVGLAPPLDRGRPVFIERDRRGARSVRPDRDGCGRDRHPLPRSTSWASISAGSRYRIASSCISVTPASAATFVTLPPCGAVTRCSIFMDSSTAICWPGRTRSPSLTSMATMVPCSGAGTGDRAGRPGSRAWPSTSRLRARRRRRPCRIRSAPSRPFAWPRRPGPRHGYR